MFKYKVISPRGPWGNVDYRWLTSNWPETELSGPEIDILFPDWSFVSRKFATLFKLTFNLYTVVSVLQTLFQYIIFVFQI